MLFRCASLLAAVLPASVVVTLADEPPATRPSTTTWSTTRPATLPTSTIQNWFNDLAASDAAERERAFAALLGLTRADLPSLRSVVEQSRPLAPSQAAALHDVVTHAYLSGETYDANPRSGFLGLLQPVVDAVDVPDAAAAAGEDAGVVAELRRARTGVPIEYRLPGFCAFRELREGDIILGITAPVPRRLRDWNELSITVMTFPAGETVSFEVLREGRVRTVPIRLDARPVIPNAIENIWTNEILPARELMAEEYWATHFLPLVEERVSSAAR